MNSGVELVVYTLQLAGGHYYVGRCPLSEYEARLRVHFDGRGSVWTSLNAPISVLRSKVTMNPYDEDAEVLYLIDLYGVHRVRGGSFSAVRLSSHDAKLIYHQRRRANRQCYRCGRHGHYAASCRAITEVTGKPLAPVLRRLPFATLLSYCVP